MLDLDGVLDLPVAPVFLPALRPSRYKALFSGRGGAKSYFAATFILMKAIEGRRCLCIREVQISLEQSSKQLLEDLIMRYGLQRHCRVLKTHIETAAGGRIDFRGMQNYNAMNIKSLEGYEYAWWEEAQAASQYSLDLLIPTIRKTGSELLFTWNPEFPEDPVDVMFRGPNPVSGAIVIESSWRDNPWLNEVLRDEMLDAYRRDAEKAEWIWGGAYRTVSDAQIMKGKFVAREFTPEPHWDGPYQGLDFGFSNDPTAGVRLWRNAKTLYVEYAAGATGIEIDKTAQFMQDRIPDWDIYTKRCDNARPETISYLNRTTGTNNYVAAPKWPGSVEDGISWYRSHDEIVVHPINAQPFLRECKLYSYKVNKAGDVLTDIVDAENHYIDAGRYAASPLIKTVGNPRARTL